MLFSGYGCKARTAATEAFRTAGGNDFFGGLVLPLMQPSEQPGLVLGFLVEPAAREAGNSLPPPGNMPGGAAAVIGQPKEGLSSAEMNASAGRT